MILDVPPVPPQVNSKAGLCLQLESPENVRQYWGVEFHVQVEDGVQLQQPFINY